MINTKISIVSNVSHILSFAILNYYDEFWHFCLFPCTDACFVELNEVFREPVVMLQLFLDF